METEIYESSSTRLWSWILTTGCVCVYVCVCVCVCTEREREKEKGRLYTKQQSPNGVILFYAQYNGHIKIIQMIKKFATDHISSLRQEEAHFTPLLLLSTSKTPDERYRASIRRLKEKRRQAGWRPQYSMKGPYSPPYLSVTLPSQHSRLQRWWGGE